MGATCSCVNFGLNNENEFNVQEQKIVNKDFFADYTSEKERNNNKNNINNDIIKINLNKENSLNISNNIEIIPTQNVSSMNNMLLFNSGSYINNSSKEMLKEGKNILLNNNENKSYVNLKEKSLEINPLLNNNFEEKKEQINNQDIIYNNTTEIKLSKKNIKEDKNEIISEKMMYEKPEDEYSRRIFDYINKLRTEPKSIAEEIENNKKYIIIGKNNEIYFKKNKIKIYLNVGSQLFDEAINFLNNFEPINKLIYDKNITIPIPNDINIINNLDYLNKKVDDLNNNGQYIVSFWKEKTKDPEIAFLMMVVDDNPKKARQKIKDLINPEIKYIGIGSQEINNNLVCYITLSNKSCKML